MKKAVLIGAGQYGRGVIGMLLSRAGYHVVLADINEAVLQDIRERGEYTVRRIDREDHSVTVKNISALNSLSPELVDACVECDLLCTCTGLFSLGKIAPAIADSIRRRRESGFIGTLNVLACENAIGGSTVLKGHVMALLNKEEAEWAEKHIGFPDCAIDGIIPPVKNALPADVTAEEYYEWDALRSGFRGTLPEIPELTIVDDLAPYLERKLFTLNGPNAVTGAMGFRKGYATVQESLADREIYEEVWGMMEEAGEMLCRRHGFTREEMLEYRSFIMGRFSNEHVPDYCERVAREPLRKLAANDRIVTAMNHANALGLDTPAFERGIAEVLCYDNPRDEQSRVVQEKIRNMGVRAALEEISGIPQESETAQRIEALVQTIYHLQHLTETGPNVVKTQQDEKWEGRTFRRFEKV